MKRAVRRSRRTSRPRPFRRALIIGATATIALIAVVVTGLWITYGRVIDARLTGDQPAAPRIYARPFELRTGQVLSPAQLVERLNEAGYAQREDPSGPGEFRTGPRTVQIHTRGSGDIPAGAYQVDFTAGNTPTVTRITADGGSRVSRMQLEAPLLASLVPGERRRHVPLDSLPPHVVDAVLAIEDRRFFDHPGVDPIRAIGAIVTNLRGDRPYLEGASTLTQQIVKNTFLTPEKTMRRKLQEQFMALVLESRLSKAQILELYLNDIVLGQRGPFAIRGVPQAARIFFGKDVRNLSLGEAATLAGLIQSPSRLAPLRYPERARERRNVVLRAMVDAGLLAPADADAAAREPLVVANRAMENEAPYFVDYASQLVREQFDDVMQHGTDVEIHTTLDLRLQRLAQEAIADGVAAIDKRLAGRRRQGVAQAALVAIDPRTGDILAMVGGRAYSQSQYNRAVLARRQPGSVFKPFVYLAAFEDAATGGHTNFTPATLVLDEPTTFQDGEEVYQPVNFENEYDGAVTLRAALATSRNIVAIKVAEQVGYDRVAALWSRLQVGTEARAYPSIALGVFEASPVEMAEAYTVFANGGVVQPLKAITRIVENGRTRNVRHSPARRVARPDATYLVTNMMRSVLDEGSGAGARAAGFRLEAAGKTGTTNDLRDAWFIGLTPELLTAVWIGFDDNTPIGLSGSQAALPIWTSFMKRALAGRPDLSFEVPDGIVFADIDKDTGQLAADACPRVYREAFLEGHLPSGTCRTHGHDSIFSRFGSFLRLRR